MSFIDIQVPDTFQCGFQNTLDFYKSKYCFKYEYGDNGRRCLLVGEDKNSFIHWFYSLPEDKRKLYELIRETDVVAEYYDIDFTLLVPLTIEEVEAKSHDIIQSLLDARNDSCDQTISRKDIIVLSAHTSTKLSLHIISKKTYFTNNTLQRFFALSVQRALQERNAQFDIDTSVYSKNRCFRMYLNHKYKKNNTLVLFYPNIYSYASFEETWIVLTHRDYSDRVEIVKYNDGDIQALQYNITNEPLSDDLLVHLDRFIRDHPYLRAEVDKNKPINRLNRIEHTSRQCLTDPKDTHSTENMFWYVKRHELYVGCFCRKGKHICIGRREGIVRVTRDPERFDHATHSSQDFKDYTELTPFQTVYDKRATGRGKTTCAMRYAKSYERVLLIHHRLSLDDDYIQKYPEFTSYQVDTACSKQTVCFNSLAKVRVCDYDLIIVDEIRSILKQTEMRDMLVSTHVLFNILENTDIPLIMLDANLTNEDICFLQKHRKDNKAVVIHDNNCDVDKTVYFMDNEQELLADIDRVIHANEKVVLIYNRSIEYMNSLLQQYSATKRILHINKLTRKQVNMDTSTWYDNFDIIAYSPTISEGVSITDSRFKQVCGYGLFVSTSCPAESVSQMIARFRAIESFSVHCDDSKKKNIPEFKSIAEIKSYLYNNINRLERLSNTHLNYKRDRDALVIIEDEFFELYCKNLLETSRDYNNYIDTMIQKLINNGYSIYENQTSLVSEQVKSDIAEHIKELRKNEKQRTTELILTCNALTRDEYCSLRDNGPSNELEDSQLQKYTIVETLQLKPDYLTLDIVSVFRNPQKRHQIRNIKYIFEFMIDENGQTQRIHPNVIIQNNAYQRYFNLHGKLSFLEQKESVASLSVHKLDWLNKRVMELGFDHLLSPEPIALHEFERNLDMIIQYYRNPNNYKDYADSQLIFGKTCRRAQQACISETFLMSKLSDMFAITFGKDKDAQVVYQQVSLPICLYDPTFEKPNILGRNALMDERVIRDYDIMFMAGYTGKYCSVCDRTLKTRIDFRHLNSQKHKLKKDLPVESDYDTDSGDAH